MIIHFGFAFYSLHEGIVYHLQSTRYGLVADCDVKIINDIANVEASTRSMNLFAL